jgi:hypothetical protein
MAEDLYLQAPAPKELNAVIAAASPEQTLTVQNEESSFSFRVSTWRSILGLMYIPKLSLGDDKLGVDFYRIYSPEAPDYELRCQDEIRRLQQMILISVETKDSKEDEQSEREQTAHRTLCQFLIEHAAFLIGEVALQRFVSAHLGTWIEKEATKSAEKRKMDVFANLQKLLETL